MKEDSNLKTNYKMDFSCFKKIEFDIKLSILWYSVIETMHRKVEMVVIFENGGHIEGYI